MKQFYIIAIKVCFNQKNVLKWTKDELTLTKWIEKTIHDEETCWHLGEVSSTTVNKENACWQIFGAWKWSIIINLLEKGSTVDCVFNFQIFRIYSPHLLNNPNMFPVPHLPNLFYIFDNG